MSADDTFFFEYRPHRFNKRAQATLVQANEILDDMRAQGYVLTLRQLYYQFVRRAWIDNNEREYKRLGRIVTDARESGQMDWNAIEDRGRSAWLFGSCDDPSAILSGIYRKLRLDPWLDQDTYVEVWVEKQALESVVGRPCGVRGIPYMACKGYLSASEAQRAGRRFEEAISRGKRPVLIHLADHDPSGLDMTDDNRKRLRLFSLCPDVEIRRLALNMDQVEQYSPPPNPAKESDARYPSYRQKFGQHSWELDALEPSTLYDLIHDAVEEYVDEDIWQATLARQEELRRPLKALEANWDQLSGLLGREDVRELLASVSERPDLLSDLAERQPWG